MENLKHTVLHEWHREHEAKLVSFGGYEMPLYYEGIVKEHLIVRSSLGMFDISHMGELLVEGEDALEFLDFLLPARLKGLPEGKVKYSFLLKEDGGIVDDLLVYIFSSTKVMLVVNASNIEKDLNYIRSFISGALSVREIDFGSIAIQGPDSLKFLSEFIDFPLESLKFYYYREGVKFKDIDVIISRTGYTGELGFEVYTESKYIPFIWEELFKKGVNPCGLGARDTLRLEAGYPLYGHELTEQINPIEAGLGVFVYWDKEFLGKDALISAKNHPNKKLIGFAFSRGGVPRQGYKLFKDNREIGLVTSGAFSPSLKKMIGLGYVKDLSFSPGDDIQVDIRGEKIGAKIVSLPFYKTEKRR